MWEAPGGRRQYCDVIVLELSHTQQGDEAVRVLRTALVAHHFLVGDVEGAVAAAGAAGVAGRLGSAVGAPPTQAQAASEAH